MKKKTITNLAVATVAVLGVSYIAESYIKSKKRNLEIETSKKRQQEEIQDNKKRTYHTIGNIVMENGKPTTKQLKKVI